nr:PAS domain-containing protein [Marivibrio halodurans]
MEVRSDRLKRVLAVWRGLEMIADGTPRRASFSPHCLDSSDLPYVVLVDVIDGGADFRFRLAGTEVVRAVGREFTGLRLSENLHLPEVPDLVASYRECLRARAPVVYRGTLARFGKKFVTYERLTLPLADEAGDITTILGALDFGVLEGR